VRVDPQHGRFAPLVPRASRASSTCASQQRAPLASTPTDSSLPLSVLSYSDHSATSFHLSLVLPVRFSTRPFLELSLSTLLYTCASQHVFCHVRLASTSFRKQLQLSSGRVQTRPLSPSHKYSALLSLSHCAPPSSGRVASVSANMERTRRPSPCLSSLRKQADNEPSQQRSARAFWRETSPRPRRVSIRPSGSGPHGARLMASAVGGVCRGGGVVASLVYERGV